MKKIRKKILSILLTCAMVVSLCVGISPMEVHAEDGTTLKYEVVGGTGSMDPVTLTVGEKFTLPEPSFTPGKNREFYGWFVYDSVGDGEIEVSGYEKPEFIPKGDKTYTAIACYGYPVTVKNLPEGTNISYMSKMINNPSALVIPEAGEVISEEVNCFIIQNSSMTSAPIFTGENGSAEFVRSSDGKYIYVVRDITGPVTLTLTDAPEVSGNIERKENVSITKLEANKYEVQGLEEEEGFTWVYNLGSVGEGQDVDEKVATELAGWLSCEKGKYVELKKVWGIDDEPYIISGDFLRKQIDDYDYVQIFKLDAQENVHEVALLALPKDAVPEVTYDITLDRTNYADGYVDLYTYNSEGRNVENTQDNNATIAMPEGGKVRVFADSEFTVTAEGATISEMLNAGDEGYYYEITNIAQDTTLVVNKVTTPVVTAPIITGHPQNASVQEGETATFNVTATGEGVTYQWQIDRNDGKGFVNIDGATSASYTMSTVDMDCNGFKYQCIVSNAGGSVTTNTATLTVTIATTDDSGDLEKDADVAPDAPIDEATLDNSKEELLEAGNIFTETEKTQIANGMDARVWLEISKTDESAIASTDKAKIEQEATKIMGDNLIVTYFDADLFKQVGSGAKQEITEPGVAMKITITIPDELLNSDKTVSREYKIIRLHEGQVDVINGTFDSTTGEFTFESDKFSTYAIVYKDVPVNANNPTPGTDDDAQKPEDNKKDEAPKTGDSNNTLYSFVLMLLSGLGIIICSRKEKILNKEN